MTLPGSYRTDANGDYGIMAVQLAEGDWLATTREFRAFGETQADAVAKLGQCMREAAESILKLAVEIGKAEIARQEASIES